MKTVQFLIDNICADFTVASLLGLARACLAKGPCTLRDIATAIMRKDPSLDIKCAEGLAHGALQALSESGEVEVKESTVYGLSAASRPQ